MAYFPKSQIKPNLYTNGGEYILSTTKENYKGPYYETSTGQKFTGKTPQDGPNIPLLLYLNIPSELVQNTEGNVIEIFNILTPDADNPLLIDPLNKKILNGLSNRFIPLSNPTYPTDQDIQLGVYTRYFCKKNNELKYMEIDKTTFEKLNTKSKDIAWDLYTPVSTLWYLRGNVDSYGANKGLVSLIEKNQKWYGFTQWFKDKFF
jgi:hypothetical protein